MADMIMLVDVALAEAPVNVFPLTDDTDFKSRETAVAYNAAGMDLVWNFVDVNGNYTQTAVTPTTSGAYDWAHQGDGMYSIEVPASGGGSINNDSEGVGWFTGIATGVLAWRGPFIQFMPANVVNSFIVGSDKLEVDAVQFGGTNATAAAGIPEVKVASIAANAVNASALATDAVTEVGTGVWATTTRLLTAGTNIVLAKGTGVTGLNDLDAAGVRTATGLASANLDTQLAKLDTIDDFLDSEINAIKTKTDALPASYVSAADVLTQVNSALDAIVADSVPADGTRPSVRQALYMLTQFMLERSVSSTTVTVKKVDGTTSLFTLTLNDATSPSSITRAT